MTDESANLPRAMNEMRHVLMPLDEKARCRLLAHFLDNELLDKECMASFIASLHDSVAIVLHYYLSRRV